MTFADEHEGRMIGGKDLEKNSNWDVLLSLFILIRKYKKWWLLPFLFMLAFLSLFVTLSGNQSILPAIYALF